MKPSKLEETLQCTNILAPQWRRMPDGTIRKTEAVTSRWANISIDWEDKTPEQQIFSVLKVIFGIFALAISFAVTACFMIICVISMLTMIIKKVLQVLAGTFGARVETVCGLLISLRDSKLTVAEWRAQGGTIG